ncbi:MAG: HlyD family secretion protein [Candidatus Sumerlaeia bacterium]
MPALPDNQRTNDSSTSHSGRISLNPDTATNRAPVPFEKKIHKVRIALALAILLAISIVVGLCMAPIEDYYTAEGRVLPGSHRKLFAEHKGKVSETLVREGEAVKVGQVLMHFELRDMKLEIEDLEAQLEKLKADLAYQEISQKALERLPLPKEFWEIQQQADKSAASVNFYKTKLQRLEKVSKAGATSQQEMDMAKLELRQAQIEHERWEQRLELVQEGYGETLLAKAQAEVDRIKVQIANLEKRLERLRADREKFSVLKAPEDGTILTLFHDDPGEIVEAGSLLVYMETGEGRIVEIAGGQLNFHKVRVGQPVRFKSSLYDAMQLGYAEGYVTRIERVREHLQNEEPGGDTGFYPIYATITKSPVEMTLDSTVKAQIVLRKDRMIKVLFDRN